MSYGVYLAESYRQCALQPLRCHDLGLRAP